MSPSRHNRPPGVPPRSARARHPIDEDEPTVPQLGEPRVADDAPTEDPAHEPVGSTTSFDDEETVPRPGPLSDEPTVPRPGPLSDEPTAPRPPPLKDEDTNPVTFTKPATPEVPPVASPPPQHAGASSRPSHPLAGRSAAGPPTPGRGRRLLRILFLTGGLLGTVVVFALFGLAAWMYPDQVSAALAQVTSAVRDATPQMPESAEARPPSIRISVDATDVPITIDGDEVGTAPTDVRLEPGEHEVVVGRGAAATPFWFEVGRRDDAWCFAPRKSRFHQVPCVP